MVPHQCIVILIASVLAAGGYPSCEIFGDRSSASTHVSVADNCSAGVIWTLGGNALTVTFPRTALPDLTNSETAMKICFEGGYEYCQLPDVQKPTRRNRKRAPIVNVKIVSSAWDCSRPSWDPKGIIAHFESSDESVRLAYRVEVVERKKGRCKIGDRNYMREKDRYRGRNDRRNRKGKDIKMRFG